MMRDVAVLAAVLAASGAFAGDKADKRAVAFCVAKDSNFVKVEKCLPDAHVSMAVLDAVREIYGDAGSELATRCLDVNEANVIGAATCARQAIDAAINLSKKLPAGSTIPDPLYSSLIDPQKNQAVSERAESAKSLFPEKRLWGGTMYRPLK